MAAGGIRMTDTILIVWMTITLFLLCMATWGLYQGLRQALRRNENLTMMLAVREAHGGKGTDAARAHVAALRELRKDKDKVAAGLTTPAPKPTGLRMKQSTP